MLTRLQLWWQLRRVRLRTIDQLLRAINEKVDMTQENLASLTAKIDRQTTALTNIRQDIADIKAGLPTAGGLSQAEVDELSAKLEAATSATEALDAENPAPPTP